MFMVPLALMLVALSALAWIINENSDGPARTGSTVASVSRELARLDAFSFFVLPGEDYGADHVVVGATGAFAIRVGQATIDGNIRRDVARARRAAKRVTQGVGVAAVHTTIRPVLCLPGRQFRPRTAWGVKVIPWGQVVSELAERQRTVTPHQTRRVVEALGGFDSLPVSVP